MAKKSNSMMDNASFLPFLFRFHHVNACDNDDDDFYCVFMRYFQLFVAFILLCIILYVIYLFVLMPLLFKKGK
ncbi:MAG: hypothetical protein CL926_11940 [Deltaproteobacteria bacterium]|nr:hypothetical protein [Deltaproteobacteria bacterium]